MKEFKDLTEDQQKLFGKLKTAITSCATINRPSVAGILEKYKPENKDSKNEDIEAVFTAFWEDELDSLAGRDDLGRMSAKYTLSVLAIKHNNVEALKQILSEVGKIDGLERLVLTETQYKNSELKKEGHSLLNYANLHKISYEEAFKHVNDFSSSAPNKSEMISEAKKQLDKAIEIVEIISEEIITKLGTQVPKEQQNQDVGANTLNANKESDMKESNNLTPKQKQKTLFRQLKNEISCGTGVAGILEQYKSENEESYAKDIEAVFTVFSPAGDTLLSYVVFWKNSEALEDILNAVEKIDGLKKKILNEVQCKNLGGKDYTLLDYAKLYISPNKENPDHKIVEIIQNMAQVPEEQHNQAAGPVINSPKSPSFLSQHKGKVAIGAVASLIVGAMFLNAGSPLAGIFLLAVGVLLLLATRTEKGRELCDGVRSTISSIFSQSVQSKEKSTNL